MKKKHDTPALIRHIKKNYTHVVCFSPHLDDAVFSAGGLLGKLAKDMPIAVVNVFTNPGDRRNTLSAKQFLKQCAVPDAKQLFEVRLQEDKQSLSMINAQVMDLDYTDAMWRKKKKSLFPIRLAGRMMPEFVSLYPTYRYHVIKGTVHKQDRELMVELARKFRNIAPDPTKIAVFAPVGVGGHVDHCLVRDACRLAFGKDVFYWLDFPYFFKSGTENDFIVSNTLKTHAVPVTARYKKQLCEKYLSQYDIVITDKRILSAPEKFYKTA